MDGYTTWQAFRHKKTGNLYRAMYSVLVTNATNAQNGQAMILYERVGEKKQFYVRELNEFLEKFEIVNEQVDD